MVQCDIRHMDRIQELAADGAVTILFPDTVLMELDKCVNSMENDIIKIYNATELELIKTLDAMKKPSWNEGVLLIGVLKDNLSKVFAEWKEAWLIEAKDRYRKIRNIADSSNAIRLPFDIDIMFRTSRRWLNGCFVTEKRGDKRPEGDCFLIDSLVRHFETSEGEEQRQLILCTENVKHFGVVADNAGAIHPVLKEGLPHSQILMTLEGVVDFIEKERQVNEPSVDSVEKALETRKIEEMQEDLVSQKIEEMQKALLEMERQREQLKSAINGIISPASFSAEGKLGQSTAPIQLPSEWEEFRNSHQWVQVAMQYSGTFYFEISLYRKCNLHMIDALVTEARRSELVMVKMLSMGRNIGVVPLLIDSMELGIVRCIMDKNQSLYFTQTPVTSF